jgi:hypothetical protein
MTIKLFCISLFVLSLFSSSARLADVLPFSWSTTGTFSKGASGLTFSGVSAGAEITNAAGKLSINLGTFTLADVTTDLTGFFSLKVKFLSPDGVQALSFEKAQLDVDANINAGGKDRLVVDFPDASLVTFDGGSFTFAVQDVNVVRSGTASQAFKLTGNISGAAKAQSAVLSAVPEPTSVILFATVMAGVAVAGRKKLLRR